ncbi:hypothetical protein DI272_03980 [Streptomyces sp. Act143]|uniref:LysR substrate-binding domain-containing protein n=1 Tax=Streptomyces sp. Act143 TaxID=2200760 RepID=UPI000D6773E8|nr:hypothetical protein DI272_03980 [Streptomyces sp. Act143]
MALPSERAGRAISACGTAVAGLLRPRRSAEGGGRSSSRRPGRRPLGRMRYVAAASPGLVDRHFGGPLGDAPAKAPVVTFDRRDSYQDRFARELRGGAGGASPARHAIPTSEGFVGAVTLGLGWGMVPEVQAGPLLRAGRLIQPAPERPVDAPLYWQQCKPDSPALAAVADAVTTAAAEALRS